MGTGSAVRHGASGGLRLLVVDADPLQASALAMLLQEEGFDAKWASPWHAVAESVRYSLDAIILDVDMPGLNGTDVLTRLRERDPQLPAVVTSGLPREDQRIMAAMALPAVSYLCKPINLRRLLGCLDGVVESLGHSRRLARRPTNI